MVVHHVGKFMALSVGKPCEVAFYLVNGMSGCSVRKPIRKCSWSLVLNDQALEDGIGSSCGEGVFGVSQRV